MDGLFTTSSPDALMIATIRNLIAAENCGKGLPIEPVQSFGAFQHDAGELVAGLVGQSRWDMFLVTDIFVAKSHRNRGIASELLKAAEAEACKRGCKGIRATTSTLEAPGFYERHDYKICGEVHGFPQASSMRLYAKGLG